MEYTRLVQGINRTNSNTNVKNEMKLSDMLAERDTIDTKRKVITSFIEAGTVRVDRYSKSEIKYITTMDIKGLQKESDRLAKKYRELDTYKPIC